MKTNFGMSEEKSKVIVKYLNKTLANTYGLYFLTLHAHWNIEDPRFLFIHEMLEKQYGALAESGDEIAERIRQMGYKALGSLKTFAAMCDFKEFTDNATADGMLDYLAICHEKTVQDLRNFSKIGEECGDYGLVDMLGTMVRDHEKTAWVLRSHL